MANDEKKMNIKQERREEALAEICVTIESQKIEAFCKKLEVQDDLDELEAHRVGNQNVRVVRIVPVFLFDNT